MPILGIVALHAIRRDTFTVRDVDRALMAGSNRFAL